MILNYAIVKSSLESRTLLVMKNLCTFNCFTVHVWYLEIHKLTYKQDAYVLTNLAGICNPKVTHRKGLVQISVFSSSFCENKNGWNWI